MYKEVHFGPEVLNVPSMPLSCLIQCLNFAKCFNIVDFFLLKP